MTDWSNIPQELREGCCWVCWTFVDEKKVPVNPNAGSNASVTDSSTWGTFEEAVAGADAGHVAGRHVLGVGRVFTKDDPYTGIDLDPKTAEQKKRSKQIVETFDSYTETSISRQGAHIIVRGTIPHSVKRDGVEAYDTRRYFIFTGNSFRGGVVQKRQEMLNVLFQEMSRGQVDTHLFEWEKHPSDQTDAEVMAQVTRAQLYNDLCAGNWKDQYTSQSDADFALMCRLCRETNSDTQVVSLFLASGLGQRKKAQRRYDDYVLPTLKRARAEVGYRQAVEFSEELKNGPSPVELQAPAIAALPDKVQTAPPPVTLPQGLVGELAQYVIDTAPRPQPHLALMGSLLAVSAVTRNRYVVSYSDTYLNLYGIAIAKTSAGKEYAFQGPAKVLRQVLTNGIIEGAASAPALVRGLSENLNSSLMLWVDEIWTLMNAMNSDKDSYAKELASLIMTLYGRAGTSFEGRIYADTKKNIERMERPYLVFGGTSTPHRLTEAMRHRQVVDGFLNRVLVFLGDEPRSLHLGAKKEPPRTLVDQAKEVYGGPTLSTQPVSISVPDDVQALLKQFSDGECDEHLRKDELGELWGRGFENAVRVAGVVAVGVNPTAPVITRDIAQWSINLVRRLITDLQQLVRQEVAESEFDRKCKRALSLIRNPKTTQDKHQHLTRKGLMPRTLLLNQTGWSSKELNEVISTLVEREAIEVMKIGERGRAYKILNKTLLS